MSTNEREPRVVSLALLGNSASFWKILTLASLIACTSCGIVDVPAPTAIGCKIRTYIDTPVVPYISDRYGSRLPVRVAVIPFDVPESFAPAGEESLHYGRVLAGKFQRSLLQSQELPIVELFNRDRWPGKQDEFATGNHRAIELAKNAGYDFVVVGSLGDIVNERDLVLQTKMIDVNTGVSLWYAETTATSDSRMLGREMSKRGVSKYQPDRFYFTERSDELASCTVARFVLEAHEDPIQ